MYQTILVPTDGSDHSLRAAQHGRYLAALFDASVHVVTAVDVQGEAGLFDAGGVTEEFRSRLRAEGERVVEATGTALADHDDVTTAVVEGEASEAILEYADAHDADLLAMGTHGRTGLNRFVAGSVTERVVRRADVPVLTVRAVERSALADDYAEVLVPTDGSEAATAAVDHALAIAERAGARVHAVHVVDIGEMASASDYTLPTEVLEGLESAGEAATERIADRARDRGLDVTTTVTEGPPATELLRYAAEQDVDLIAMATAGRSGLGRHLLGSTTERVLRRAEMPVLAVDAGDLVVE